MGNLGIYGDFSEVKASADQRAYAGPDRIIKIFPFRSTSRPVDISNHVTYFVINQVENPQGTWEYPE
jgi:hypothetical protein